MAATARAMFRLPVGLSSLSSSACGACLRAHCSAVCVGPVGGVRLGCALLSVWRPLHQAGAAPPLPQVWGRGVWVLLSHPGSHSRAVPQAPAHLLRVRRPYPGPTSGPPGCAQRVQLPGVSGQQWGCGAPWHVLSLHAQRHRCGRWGAGCEATQHRVCRRVQQHTSQGQQPLFPHTWHNPAGGQREPLWGRG